ncbi:MAG: hypothetical protein PHC28_09290 [Flavobacterium sp.]|uniref:hypothetical protein n=1 Tax=Flavobacterium sp. TaxID=239 RepID=UPI00260A017F|nr:hypothetical protein [Flavobacterium sp.]MDD5150663.1 hypothetical protein [Flavobacterium sp.]
MNTFDFTTLPLHSKYSEGWKANYNNESLKSCPYPKHSEEARYWCKGWYDANEDDLVLLDKTERYNLYNKTI